MANAKITDLPTLTTADAADVMELVDVSANTSKQVTVAGLATAVGANIPNSTITTSMISFGAAKAYTSNAGTTTSTSYTGTLSGTPGTNPTVTVTVGASGMVWYAIKAYGSNNTTAGLVQIAVAVSGATTIAAGQPYEASIQVAATLYRNQLMATGLITGLTPGSNTFTLNYAVANGGSGSGTGTFSERSISILPL